MAVKQVIVTIDEEAGEVRAVYDDALQPIFEEMGEVQTCRATDVEPNNDGYWEAKSRDGNFEYSSTRRNDCLEKEVAYLNSEVLPSKKRTDKILDV